MMLRLPRCEVLTQVLEKIKVVWDVTVSNNGPCNTCCSVNKLCFLPFSVFLCHIQQEEDFSAANWSYFDEGSGDNATSVA